MPAVLRIGARYRFGVAGRQCRNQTALPVALCARRDARQSRFGAPDPTMEAMFESLTDKLQGAFKKFGSRGIVTEEDLDLRSAKCACAMLEADVNFKVCASSPRA